MVKNRGAAAPAAAKPKLKRRKSKSQSKANKPSMKTGRQAQADPTLNQMTSSRGRLDSYNAGYQEVMARLDREG